MRMLVNDLLQSDLDVGLVGCVSHKYAKRRQMILPNRFKTMFRELIQDCKKHKRLLLVVSLLALMNLLRMMGF
jgi:hypothetical protein